MPGSCAVPLCNNRGGFTFPKDPIIRKKWRVLIKRVDDNKKLWNPTENSQVCAAHFKEDDFDDRFVHICGIPRRRLKKDAIPSLNLPLGSTHTQSRTAKKRRKRSENQPDDDEDQSLFSELDEEPDPLDDPSDEEVDDQDSIQETNQNQNQGEIRSYPSLNDKSVQIMDEKTFKVEFDYGSDGEGDGEKDIDIDEDNFPTDENCNVCEKVFNVHFCKVICSLCLDHNLKDAQDLFRHFLDVHSIDFNEEEEEQQVDLPVENPIENRIGQGIDYEPVEEMDLQLTSSPTKKVIDDTEEVDVEDEEVKEEPEVRKSKKVEDDKVMCEMCGKNVDNMKRHHKVDHVCKVCHETVVDMKEHRNTCQFRCYLCPDQFFRTMSTLTAHQKKEHSVKEKEEEPVHPSKKIICGNCGKVFYGNDMFSSHCRIKHAQDLSCPKCDTEFKNLKEIVGHYRSNHVNTFFKCTSCAEILPDLETIKNHVETVHDKKSFQLEDDCIAVERAMSYENVVQQEKWESAAVVDESKPKRRKRMKKLKKTEETDSEPKIEIIDIKDAYISVKVNSRDMMQCKQCNYRGYNEELISSHYEIVHKSFRIGPPEIQYNCDRCKFSTSSQVVLTWHKTNSHGKKCVCQDCSLGFVNETDYTRHVVEKHAGIFKCNDCSSEFSTYLELEKHVIDKGKPGRYPCVLCGQVFNYSGKLHIHISSSHKPGRDACPQCDKPFNTKFELIKHLEVEHGEPFESCFRIVDDLADRKNQGKCHRKCQYQSDDRQEMRDHIFHKHGDDLGCQICGQDFRNFVVFEEHVKHLHSSQFRCRMCGIVFDSISPLRIHMKRELLKGEYICDVCGKSFTHSESVLKHRRTYHSGKKIKCEYCDFETHKQKSLEDHIRCKHEGGIPMRHTCHVCGKQFAWSSNFATHLVHRHGIVRKKMPVPLEKLK